MDEAREYKKNILSGLSAKEVKKKLEEFGKNELPRKAPTSDFKIILDQLKSPLIYILIFAAIVTFFLQDYTDTLVIAAAVVINTVLGFYQERKAERALEALKSFLHPAATVLRDGKRSEIPVEQIVPGDIVILAAGEKIPADGKVVESYNLMVNEAILTGESVSVVKENKDNKVYMGTTVLGGRGFMVVEKTGARTQIGKIAISLKEQKEEKTPLQKKLSGLARWLAVLVAILAAIIFVTGILLGNPIGEMFTVAVAVAVAAIPEGLVVALTVILAIGMQRIFKRKALVRKLLAAETLGSVTLVCADKTGTLTEGQMSVERVEFTDKKKAIQAMAYANVNEDPLEIAITQWLNKESKLKSQLPSVDKVSEHPFDPMLKYQGACVRQVNGKVDCFITGAPEVVLRMSKVSEKEKQDWQRKIEKWASEGLRIVGLGYRKVEWDGKKRASHISSSGLTWLGLVGIEDPVRENVVETLERMHKAGIKLKIITGDYLATAVAVWQKIKAKSPVLSDAYNDEKYITGPDLENVEETTIFARVTPHEKLAIVSQLQKAGEVVALFGDGVNDAPALKRADIGIVVNEAADTAKETADMVLLDSNFKTVVAAVEEGRAIFDNIKKVALYLLSDSFSEIILIMLALVLQTPLPLTAAQILWINLITDGFPNLALTLEPKEKGILARQPENPINNLIDREMQVLIGAISTVTGIISFAIFWWIFAIEGDLVRARSVTFAALGIDSLLYVFSVRSLGKPIFKIPLLSNPYLVVAVVAGLLLQIVALYLPFFNTFLATVPLGFGAWGLILGASLLVIALIEIIKYIYSRK